MEINVDSLLFLSLHQPVTKNCNNNRKLLFHILFLINWLMQCKKNYLSIHDISWTLDFDEYEIFLFWIFINPTWTGVLISLVLIICCVLNDASMNSKLEYFSLIIPTCHWKIFFSNFFQLLWENWPRFI